MAPRPKRYLDSRLLARYVSRFLKTAGVALMVIVGGALVLGHFASGSGPVRSGRLTLDGLHGPTAIQWSPDGSATIEASVEADLFAGLGYVHGADHAWTMTLLRQVALGRLSQWFGADYVANDGHARMLGFAELASQTYDRLPEEEQAILTAYAGGANLALTSEAVANADDFLLRHIEPDPWLPWHTLAIERMLAWFGTQPFAADSSTATRLANDSSLLRFASADSIFRGFLQIRGAAQSRSWSLRIGGTHVASHQLAYGAVPIPLLCEVTLRLAGSSTMAASLPGTLMLPAGQSDARMWSVFLTSDARLAPTDSLPPPPRFDRLIDREGNETLLTFPRSAQGLYLKAEPPAPSPTAVLTALDSLDADALARDSTLADSLRDRLREDPGAPEFKTPPAWLVRWRGFGLGSDLAGWRALLDGSGSPVFALFRGDGLIVTSSGQPSSIGAPPVRREVPGGLFVASDPAGAFAADRMALLEDSAGTDSGEDLSPSALVQDVYSVWASDLVPRMVAALGNRDSLDASIKDAYAFLHGWDYRYERSSIAASIFEGWMAEFARKNGGSLAAQLDTTTQGLLRETLRDAVALLAERNGDGATGWRWELTQPNVNAVSNWHSRGSEWDRSILHDALVHPGGHPTTLFYGPSPLFGEAWASSTWAAWTITSNWNRTHIIRSLPPAVSRFDSDGSGGEVAHTIVVRRDTEITSALLLLPRE